MVAKKYGNNINAKSNNNGGKFVVGGSGSNGNNSNNKSGNFNGGSNRNANDSIKFIVDGKNALIFARQFKTKARNTSMIKFIIYDFDAKKKYSTAVPLAVILKSAFPILANQFDLTEIGDLTPQPPAQ